MLMTIVEGGFATALIGGGRSRRMGRDKGQLRDGAGRELWRRQFELLRGLGAGEVLFSCREAQGYGAEAGLRVVVDQWEEGGPMGGIVSCLEAMAAARLLVLPVDLPGMTREVLEALIAGAGPGRGGAVFRRGGFLEPLVAVYPASMVGSGRRRLAEGKLALRDWIGEGGEAMAVLDLPERWAGAFANVNDEAAWQGWLAGDGEGR